jgi:non-ribosomal peptide synthase protein (TIGR01720 family)
VAQYFPSADYLRRVLTAAVRAVAGTGTVFVGDVRSLSLLETFALSVEFSRAADDLPIKALRERIRRRLMLEQELVVDPDFFRTLQLDLPEIKSVEILAKRGRQRSELTNFRYDVMLHIGATPPLVRGITPVDWTADGLTLERLKNYLEAAKNIEFIVGIPNSRVNSELGARQTLAELGTEGTVESLRHRILESTVGIDPEDVVGAGAALGYEVEIYHSWSGGPSAFDALFRRPRSASERRGPIPMTLSLESRTKPWAYYTNNPMRGLFLRNMVPRIRDFLAARLPDYMIPSQYVLLEHIPKTASGKVDRRRLPEPDHARPDLGVEYVEPTLEIEKTLAKIWSDVLHVERLGVYDNFFELGGDSILGIQIVSRARDAGLEISPKHIFSHQTIAELVQVCTGASTREIDEGPVVGEVPLTPIQRWFFEQSSDNPHDFNQAMLLKLRDRMDYERLRKSIAHIHYHHDALRLRFKSTGGEWRQFYTPPAGHVAVEEVDLSRLSREKQEQAVETAVAEAQASLDLFKGPVFRVLLFNLGGFEPARLFLTAHHLVVDAFSWRILLADLRTAYEQVSRGEPIVLGDRTASYKRWAELLQMRSESPTLLREASYWASQAKLDFAPLPSDLMARPNMVESLRTVTVELDANETTVLLHRLPELFNLLADEVVLAALVQAVAGWTGNGHVWVDIERNGRDDLFDRIDLSRTVGCFATIVPTHLCIEDGSAAEEMLKSIKEQLRTLPNRGIGFGILRYLCPNADVRRSLQEMPRAEIGFRCEHLPEPSVQGGPWNAEVVTHASLARSGKQWRHKLEITGRFFVDRLSLDFEFSANFHKVETVERLASESVRVLRELVLVGQSTKERRLTASDFSRAKLSQRDFAKLMAQLADKRRT